MSTLLVITSRLLGMNIALAFNLRASSQMIGIKLVKMRLSGVQFCNARGRWTELNLRLVNGTAKHLFKTECVGVPIEPVFSQGTRVDAHSVSKDSVAQERLYRGCECFRLRIDKFQHLAANIVGPVVGFVGRNNW